MALVNLTSIYTSKRWNLDTTTGRKIFIIKCSKFTLVRFLHNYLKLLVSSLGFPFFDSIKKPTKKNLLFCKGKDAKAEGEFIEDGLVVFSGSTCNKDLSKSSQGWLTKIRKQLIESDVLKLEDNVYRFTSNHIFSSPSAAAATVLARSANGWNEWKSKDGKTLHELYRKK